MGAAPRKVDRLLSQTWTEGLENVAEFDMVVYGEEVDDAELAHVDDGIFVAVVDPLDGTTNWTTLGIGSAMSVVVYRKRKYELVYLGVHIIQLNWRRHWWAEPTATWRGTLDSSVANDEMVLSSREVNPRKMSDLFVAGVGTAKGETRDFLNHLTATGQFKTVTLGGTPLGPELLDRELYAIVECKSSTVFDSAHLMLMSNTDAVVGMLDGTVLNSEELKDIFLRPRLAKDRSVVPYIVCKDRAGFEQIADAYAEYKDEIQQ